MSKQSVVVRKSDRRRSARRIEKEVQVFEGGTDRSPTSAAQVLQRATASLRGVSDSPRIESEILLMHVLGTSRARLLAHPERTLTSAQVTRYGKLVDDRTSGYPLPYLTGKMEFYGLDIEVTPEVLIPRPETEALVDLALDRRPKTVVDVGTGSGCIAVALAAHLPETVVYGIDISPAALAVARRNAERHGVGGRVRLIAGDLLDRRPGPVDLIVSNPPYVSADEWASLPPSVRDHEPRLALDGGPDGLEVVRRLLSQTQGLLKPGGALLIEIGAAQGDAARKAAETVFPENGTSIRIHPDLAGRDRILEIQT